MNNNKESVKETIRHYKACQRTKVVTTITREETIKLTATEPGEKIYIYICGPLNETFRKKKYIIGIIDHFSKVRRTKRNTCRLRKSIRVKGHEGICGRNGD